LKLLAKQMNKQHLSRVELCTDPEVKHAVMDAVVSTCKSAGLHRRETPVLIHLCSEVMQSYTMYIYMQIAIRFKREGCVDNNDNNNYKIVVLLGLAARRKGTSNK